MKKTAFLFVAFVFVALVYLTMQPADVRVGPVTVFTNHSKGYVVLNNWIGDSLGYRRCMLTGLSLYWAKESDYALARELKTTDSKFLTESGHIVSTYGVEGLKKIDNEFGPNIVYVVAQESYVTDMIRHNSYDGLEKLQYPVRYWSWKK